MRESRQVGAIPSLSILRLSTVGCAAYHGRHSFETFSHRKAVLRRGFKLDIKMMYPPYTAARTKMVKRML